MALVAHIKFSLPLVYLTQFPSCLISSLAGVPQTKNGIEQFPFLESSQQSDVQPTQFELSKWCPNSFVWSQRRGHLVPCQQWSLGKLQVFGIDVGSISATGIERHLFFLDRRKLKSLFHTLHLSTGCNRLPSVLPQATLPSILKMKGLARWSSLSLGEN